MTSSAQPEEHHASENYDAAYEQADDGPFMAAGRWFAGVADAFLGGDGSDALGATVVVRRIDNDAEILRITGNNIDEAEGLLALVRRDLENLTREEFLAEWGGKDGVETIGD
ncbi:hypothetical protein [Zhihengliuella salsuginis]|uniref:Uncharacterized protein n=1 Tax=Zhihengliuella salsuginis TaxID=578222 RepID=A0ABQ3GM34_9MICC|nr:hypothetical protein [Zhihengliuella salsuginis]GHD09864.1 hypothetical protein GCM10008096_22950 [Zhihengliuella salsuginis]